MIRTVMQCKLQDGRTGAILLASEIEENGPVQVGDKVCVIQSNAGLRHNYKFCTVTEIKVRDGAHYLALKPAKNLLKIKRPSRP